MDSFRSEVSYVETPVHRIYLPHLEHTALSKKNRHKPSAYTPSSNAPSNSWAAQRGSSGHRRLKTGLIIFFIAFSVLCNIDYFWRVQQQRQRLADMGFTPYPGGNDNDLHLFWKLVPDHLLSIVGIQSTGPGLTALTVGASLWFALIAWGLRETIMPYVTAVIAVGFNVLCTGAFFASPHFPLSISVDQDKGIIMTDLPNTRICNVSEFVIDERHGARGGPSYWIVAHLKSGTDIDLTVFDSASVAQRVKASLADAIHGARCPGYAP